MSDKLHCGEFMRVGNRWFNTQNVTMVECIDAKIPKAKVHVISPKDMPSFWDFEGEDAERVLACCGYDKAAREKEVKDIAKAKADAEREAEALAKKAEHDATKSAEMAAHKKAG